MDQVLQGQYFNNLYDLSNRFLSFYSGKKTNYLNIAGEKPAVESIAINIVNKVKNSNYPLSSNEEYTYDFGEAGGEDKLNFSLYTFLTQAQIDDIKIRFKALPRNMFDSFIDELMPKINDITVDYITMPKEIQREAVASNLLEIYNQVNLEEFNRVKAAGIITGDVWAYERMKQEAIDLAEAQLKYQESGLEAELSAAALVQEERAKQRSDFEVRYMNLVKIGDPVLEIQRSAAFKLLLDQGDFETADHILQFYESLSEEFNLALQTKV